MSLRTIDPRDMNAMEWTAATTLNLERFGSVPQLFRDDAWRDWVVAVIGLTTISGVVLPDPYDFPDWTSWALRFNEIMDSWSG